MESVTNLESTSPQKRTVPITVICIIGLLGAIAAVPMILSDQARQVGAWYPPYFAFATAGGLVSMFGLWKMKRWGFFLYIALGILNQVMMLAKGSWSPYGLMLPLLVSLIVAKDYKKLG